MGMNPYLPTNSSLARILSDALLSSININNYLFLRFSSAVDTTTGHKVAIKKLARPFQSAVHAKRTYRELRMLKHMNHENVSKEKRIARNALLKLALQKSEEFGNFVLAQRIKNNFVIPRVLFLLAKV